MRCSERSRFHASPYVSRGNQLSPQRRTTIRLNRVTLSIETMRKSLQKFDRLPALDRTFVTFSLTDYHGSIGNTEDILCDAYNRQREEGQRVVERDDERRRGKPVEKSKFRE